MIFAIFCICILTYWVSQAVVEVMVWQCIYGHKPIMSGDYHHYRLFEVAGILAAVVSAYFVDLSTVMFFIGMCGVWILGWTVYEGVYSVMVGYGLWNKPYPYKIIIFGKTYVIHQKKWIFVTAFILGLLMMISVYS